MQTRRSAIVLSVSLVVTIGTLVPALRARQGWAPKLDLVATPAGPGSAQPQLTVSDRGVLLSWIERTQDTATLKFSERRGGNWSEPRTVASGRDWFVNWADVPSVVRLADGSLYGHWLQKSAASTYAYDVRLSRSVDDGKTWSASATPHHDGTQTEHGFASLFQMPGAGLGLVWLDGRAMKAGDHSEHGGGDMSVRSAIFDKGGAQIAEAPVDIRVCECCPTAAAITSDGPIVAYRDRSPDEIRDIYVARYVAGKWSQPAPVHKDNWRIAACPVNGPALSANGRRVAIAWFTATGDEGHTFASFSSDSGQSFSAPVRLDDASALGRVDIALLDDGSAVATWIEFSEGKAQFKMRHVKPGGERSPAVAIAGLTANRASGYPRMARGGNELIFAYAESGPMSKVVTAVTSIPR